MTVRPGERQIQRSAAFYIPHSSTLQSSEYYMCHIQSFQLNFKLTCTDSAHFFHVKFKWMFEMLLSCEIVGGFFLHSADL